MEEFAVLIVDGTISKCSNSGNVSLLGEKACWGVAGIAGYGGSKTCDTKIEYCYNTGTITLEYSNSKTTQAAGIVANCGMDDNGQYTGYVISCYNVGEIKAINASSQVRNGGIGSWGRHIVVRNCYNYGKIERKSGAVVKGIWVSYDTNLENKFENKFENNYWLNTCGADYGIGVVNRNDGAEPIGESDFKGLETKLGNDYEHGEKGYPYLKENRQ